MAAETERTRILDATDIKRKIKRIAFEILEDSYDEKDIVLAGICRDDEGYTLAEKLADDLRSIGGPNVHLASIDLDKQDPTVPPLLSSMTEDLVKDRTVVVVDDVANSGRTLVYAIRPLLELHPKKVRIAVLVDRKHKTYPLGADFVGTSLSTTLHEHIDVELRVEEGQEGVYLS